MLRPSEPAGSIFPALVFTGAGLQAAGPGCGQGLVLREGASQQSTGTTAGHAPSQRRWRGWLPAQALSV